MTELFISRAEKIFEFIIGICILYSAMQILYCSYNKHFNQIFPYAIAFIVNIIMYFLFKIDLVKTNDVTRDNPHR